MSAILNAQKQIQNHQQKIKQLIPETCNLLQQELGSNIRTYSAAVLRPIESQHISTEFIIKNNMKGAIEQVQNSQNKLKEFIIGSISKNSQKSELLENKNVKDYENFNNSLGQCEANFRNGENLGIQSSLKQKSNETFFSMSKPNNFAQISQKMNLNQTKQEFQMQKNFFQKQSLVKGFYELPEMNKIKSKSNLGSSQNLQFQQICINQKNTSNLYFNPARYINNHDKKKIQMRGFATSIENKANEKTKQAEERSMSKQNDKVDFVMVEPDKPTESAQVNFVIVNSDKQTEETKADEQQKNQNTGDSGKTGNDQETPNQKEQFIMAGIAFVVGITAIQASGIFNQDKPRDLVFEDKSRANKFQVAAKTESEILKNNLEKATQAELRRTATERSVLHDEQIKTS